MEMNHDEQIVRHLMAWAELGAVAGYSDTSTTNALLYAGFSLLQAHLSQINDTQQKILELLELIHHEMPSIFDVPE